MYRGFIFTIGILIVGLNTDVMGQAQSRITQLRQGGALEVEGAITTFYEASTKERALRLQKLLEASHEWYQQQLNIKVPIVLVVLQNATRARILGTTATDHVFFPSDGEPGLIIMADSAGDHLSFHQDGHFFADALKIKSTSKSLYELVPAIFMVAYIQEARPDVKTLDRLRTVDSQPLPRYTSWADFDDYPGGMGTPNHNWFLNQLARVADVLALNQHFPTLMQNVRSEFPAGAAKQESPEDIKAHLIRINPAFKPPQERLFAPTTIPPAAKTTCDQSNTGSNGSFLLIRNNRPEPLTVLQSETTRFVVPPYQLRVQVGPVGTVFRVSGDTCFTIGDEPTIATVN
jgi:hypothetical protein